MGAETGPASACVPWARGGPPSATVGAFTHSEGHPVLLFGNFYAESPAPTQPPCLTRGPWCGQALRLPGAPPTPPRSPRLSSGPQGSLSPQRDPPKGAFLCEGERGISKSEENDQDLETRKGMGRPGQRRALLASYLPLGWLGKWP